MSIHSQYQYTELLVCSAVSHSADRAVAKSVVVSRMIDTIIQGSVVRVLMHASVNACRPFSLCLLADNEWLLYKYVQLVVKYNAS